MTGSDDRDELFVPLPCPACGGKGVTFFPHMAMGPLRGHLRPGEVATLLAAARCGECGGVGRVRRPRPD